MNGLCDKVFLVILLIIFTGLTTCVIIATLKNQAVILIVCILAIVAQLLIIMPSDRLRNFKMWFKKIGGVETNYFSQQRELNNIDGPC